MRPCPKGSGVDRLVQAAGFGLFGLSACTASTGAGGSPSGGSGGVAMCVSPGEATPGPADNHCASAGVDGGALVNSVTLACTAGIPDDAGAAACPYAATHYGEEADDDDCKYHVTWTSTPLCQGTSLFTVVVTYKDSGKPVTGAAPSVGAFTASPGDWDAASYCDINSTHLGPTPKMDLVEGPRGTYVGPVTFDKAAVWTVRFHFFDTCTDWPTAPHGHAAFRITVP